MAWIAFRAAITMRVAVKVRGISRITSSGVLSSFNSLMRRSSVVLNTAVSLVYCLSMISAQTLRVCREGKPVPTFPDHALGPAGQTKKAARIWRLFGLLAAICQIERDPPTASELS